MDKITKAFYRSELETALEELDCVDPSSYLIDVLLFIVDSAWMDGHITGYREGHGDGVESWY